MKSQLKHGIISISAITEAELHRLYACYANRAIEGYEGLSILLTELLNEFGTKLIQMLNREQNKYTLKFKSSDAIAFVETWRDNPLNIDPIHQKVIQDIIDIIHKHHININFSNNFHNNLIS